MERQGFWLVLAAGAALLGACSTTAPPMAVKSATPAPASDPSMVWNYYKGAEGEVHLAFGTPDTDNTGILFQCRPKAGSVAFSTDLDKRAGAVRFRSGAADKRYAAKAQTSEMTGGWTAQGEIPLPDPVLAAFEKTGVISQVEDRVYPQNARTDAERAGIKRFFGVCRG
ncbi:MAG: hypothetical protein J7515_19650 [Caulobacter sp.]|nr:hypothetical protein [Caulobacter sp.]